MRVWHILRAASAAGKACPSSIFETRICKTVEGCGINRVDFPSPSDQPETEDGGTTKEADLLRPIGGLFLGAAVVIIFLILASLEFWRRWGTSMAAHREVLSVQRQRDLLAAREQIQQYRKMIQEYKRQLEDEQNSISGEEKVEAESRDCTLTQQSIADLVSDKPILARNERSS